MTTRVKSIGLTGMTAYPIEVESDIARGLARFDVVGLPDAAVKESRDRVCAAIKNCGYEFPVAKITVNLAPADTRKSGPSYDLAIMLSILLETGQLAEIPEGLAFLGELSLGGAVRRIDGALPMTIEARAQGFEAIFVPLENAAEASVVEGISVYGISHVNELISFLIGAAELSPTIHLRSSNVLPPLIFDFSEVRGQAGARRALEVAAAGGHNAIMIGSPGSGKSMLAKRLPSILPDMTFDESIETTKIHSIAGLLNKENPLVTTRPFRSPHHTISPAGLSGGGSIPRPGEISLAHNGVLFLDELPEFTRGAMEILRQPVEDSRVTISRVSGTLTYPCSVMLVAAMNPCPCGYFGHPTRPCTCPPTLVGKYLARVSGPLLDRLDLHIDVMPVEYSSLASSTPSESSAAIKARVDAARNIQNQRYKDSAITCNARITSARLRQDCPMSDKATTLLRAAFEKLGLSARAYDRVLKVARTVADLDQSEEIQAGHIGEAVQYRSLDRKYWMR